MSWLDRIREAAYRSPSGVRTVFVYEDVSKEFDKKTTAFEFPDADGTYVQDMGVSGRRYPLRVIFWGADYDVSAEAFEKSLAERGAGVLEHPIYGVIDVVPTGTITRRDDLKTGSNQTIIEVAFYETIGIIYPSSKASPASAVQGVLLSHAAALALETKDNLVLEKAVQRLTFKNKMQKSLAGVTKTLQKIADTQQDVKDQFDDINQSINLGIDILVAEPLALALQTIALIQAPARALSSIGARLDAYGNLAATIGSSADSNAFRTDNLLYSAYVTGSVVSATNTQFTTRSDAINTAELLLEQFDASNAWRDEQLQALAIYDTGESYQLLQEAIALAAGYLIDISFSLKTEHRITLDRARTIIDLTAEVYGSVDDRLDEIIATNNLSGSEILELPAGREIVFYL